MEPTGLQRASPEPLAADVTQVLQNTFGLTALRPGQRAAIDAVLAGRDALVRLPTGAGKSLCYQLPAVVLRRRGMGPTWVVSPLVALMEDQAQALRARGVHAIALHAQLPDKDRKIALGALASGDYDLLLLAPERAVLPHVLQLARRTRIALLAIDEAHCVSQWGHDFRPEYRKLGELRHAFDAPTLAATATATDAVLADIASSLGLVAPVRVLGGVLRPNLRFAAVGPELRPKRLTKLVSLLQAAPPGRRLVYAATRAMATATAAFLQDANVGAVALYHAGLSEAARRRAQQAYAGTAVAAPARARTTSVTPPLGPHLSPILVATPAFGMGIDQPDVRLVVHVQAPASPEAYYQEAGRAGRDGEPAACWLLWGHDCWQVQRRLSMGTGKAHGMGALQQGPQLLAAMQGYVAGTVCRQRYFIDYFTAVQDGPGTCGLCDVCQNGPLPPRAAARVKKAPPALSAAQAGEVEAQVLAAIAALRRPVGAGVLAQALRGGRSKAVQRRGLVAWPSHGALPAVATEHILTALCALKARGEVVNRGRKYPTVWLAGRAVRAAAGAESVGRTRKSTPPPLEAALGRYVRRTARALGWKKAYMVLPKAVIQSIVQVKPNTLEALGELRGMGAVKLARFGADILAEVRAHR